MSPHLLHLDASARSTSFSRAVGRAFADAWREADPSAGYTHRDLAADPVPHITEGWTEISAHVGRHAVDLAGLADVPATPGQRAALAVARPLIDEVQAADVLLIATPMYNFSIPAALKAWIDQVTLPGIPLGPKVGVVTAARGGSYLPGAPAEPLNFQTSYLTAYLTTYGPKDTRLIASEFTLAPVMPALAQFTDAHEESHRAALRDAAALARELVRDAVATAA